MKPSDTFLKLPKTFWASVRLISQEVGYTEKGTGRVKVPPTDQIRIKLQRCGVDFDRLQDQRFDSKKFGMLLNDYFAYRADILYSFVEPHLMDAKRASQTFKVFFKKLKPSRRVPMNKQTGEKKFPAYLTGLVNMLIKANSQGLPCDYDPQKLTTIIKGVCPFVL